MCQYVYTHFKLPFFLCLIRVAAEETVEAIKYAYSSQQTTTSTDADDSQQITTSTDVDDSHTLANVNDTAPPPNDVCPALTSNLAAIMIPFPPGITTRRPLGSLRKGARTLRWTNRTRMHLRRTKDCPHLDRPRTRQKRRKGRIAKLASDDEDDLDPSSLSSASLKIVERKGGSDDYGRVKLAGGKWISNYEYQRLQKMADNKKLMDGFDFPDAVQAVIGPGAHAPLPQDNSAFVCVPPRRLECFLAAHPSRLQSLSMYFFSHRFRKVHN